MLSTSQKTQVHADICHILQEHQVNFNLPVVCLSRLHSSYGSVCNIYCVMAGDFKVYFAYTQYVVYNLYILIITENLFGPQQLIISFPALQELNNLPPIQQKE